MVKNNSVALITGSASGIGAATANQLAQSGSHVVINYSRNESGAMSTAEICASYGVETLVIKADVSEQNECNALVSAAYEKWGRIDHLVNNAGISIFSHGTDLDTLTDEDFINLYHVNLVGPFHMVKAAHKYIKQSPNGSIVNVSSISSVTGSGSSIAYAASKGALNTLTKSLARMLAPEIRVNAVLPGVANTSWWTKGIGEGNHKKLMDSFKEKVPLQEVCSAESVAETITWLLTGAKHITGETLLIDSGTHLITFQP
ncbi:MAG TPA: oxidoreductase [Dehalococcoidia bacterium]|nr:oxidoreductase [Dehalococcoidia bacterium]